MIFYKCYLHYWITILLFYTNTIYGFFDPITMAVGGLGAGAAVYFKLTYCEYFECCDHKYIPARINSLKQDFKKSLFGQHLVEEILLPALKRHYGSKPSKPLVLSFHGPTGTGKNFVADRIAKHVYLKGTESSYVHKFHGRVTFPLDSQVEQYQLELEKQLLNAVAKCPQSLFIFDEVEKMPVGIFDTIAKILKNREISPFRDSVFIFLTNTAGTEIADKLYELTDEKFTPREYTKYSDFEEIVKNGAYNRTCKSQPTGIIKKMYKWVTKLIPIAYNSDELDKNSALIEDTLIDYFLPFLPLERKHVEMCVKEEFRNVGVDVPSVEQIKEIANSVTYHNNLYSNTGCKRLSKKVGLLVYES